MDSNISGGSEQTPPKTPAVFFRLPLAQIRVCPEISKKRIPPNVVEAMAESLKTKGLETPIQVRLRSAAERAQADEEKCYELVSGQIRMAGALKLGLERLDAFILTISKAEALIVAERENWGREFF